MEDAATAEISRSQVWQWVHHGAKLEDGSAVTAERVRQIEEEELARIRAALGESAGRSLDQARALFDQVALGDNFVDFLTFPAYDLID
jgi:malate synthase